MAIAARCRHCALYHTEVAKLNGATDVETEDAVPYTKSPAGWSTYIKGMQVDCETFRDEVLRACEHVRKQMKAA